MCALPNGGHTFWWIVIKFGMGPSQVQRKDIWGRDTDFVARLWRVDNCFYFFTNQIEGNLMGIFPQYIKSERCSRHIFCVSWITDRNKVYHMQGYKTQTTYIIDTRHKILCIIDNRYEYCVSWIPDMNIMYCGYHT